MGVLQALTKRSLSALSYKTISGVIKPTKDRQAKWVVKKRQVNAQERATSVARIKQGGEGVERATSKEEHPPKHSTYFLTHKKNTFPKEGIEFKSDLSHIT